jgi:hypothetical protein
MLTRFALFWDITKCRVVIPYQRFDTTYRSHFQGSRITWGNSRLLLAVPWLRRLVAGLPPRRPGFDPASIHVGFVVDKVALGHVFLPSTSVSPCQYYSTGAPLLGKGQKITIIFTITGLHNKPQGCSASVASAAGPFTNKKRLLSYFKCIYLYRSFKPLLKGN